MAATEPGNELTIEQLAHETGMSVRNIRNHQTRGLLPSPEVRARTGYYGGRHVERLRLIQEMQSEGFNLGAIQRLLGDEGAWAERFVGLRRAITAPSANFGSPSQACAHAPRPTLRSATLTMPQS